MRRPDRPAFQLPQKTFAVSFHLDRYPSQAPSEGVNSLIVVSGIRLAKLMSLVLPFLRILQELWADLRSARSPGPALRNRINLIQRVGTPGEPAADHGIGAKISDL